MPLQQSIKCLLMQCEYQIQVQLLEIYNEQLRDLLDNSRSHARLDIRNTERSGLNVPDAIQVPLLICLPAHSLIMATLIYMILQSNRSCMSVWDEYFCKQHCNIKDPSFCTACTVFFTAQLHRGSA